MTAQRDGREDVGLKVVIGLVYLAPRRTATGTFYCYLARMQGDTGAVRFELRVPEGEAIEGAWFARE